MFKKRVCFLFLFLVLFVLTSCNEETPGDSYVEDPQMNKLFDISNGGVLTIKPGEDKNIPSKLVIPAKVNGTKVTAIGNKAFRDCESLEEIVLPDSVTSIASAAFQYCSNLSKVTFSNSLEFIGSYAFAECSKLTNVIFPSTLKTIENRAFYKCWQIKELILPNSLKSIHWSFESTGLTSIVIPDSVTSIEGAFVSCSDLASVQLSSSITSMDMAFYNCDSLESLVIPNSVTSFDGAFDLCDNLMSVTLPISIDNLSAFYECRKLVNISYPGTISQWKALTEQDGWGYAWEGIPATVVHCSDGDVAI